MVTIFRIFFRSFLFLGYSTAVNPLLPFETHFFNIFNFCHALVDSFNGILADRRIHVGRARTRPNAKWTETTPLQLSHARLPYTQYRQRIFSMYIHIIIILLYNKYIRPFKVFIAVFMYTGRLIFQKLNGLFDFFEMVITRCYHRACIIKITN